MPTQRPLRALARMRRRAPVHDADERRRSSVRHRAGPSRHGPAWRAAVDVTPLVIAVAPLGTVVGVAIHHASIAAGTGLATSLLLFGGAANLAAVSLVGSGAGALAVLGAVLVVNARLALYGAALEPRWRHQPAWFRWLGPQLIVDGTYALAVAHPETGDPDEFRIWWLTVGGLLGTGWGASIAAGIALGPILPADSPLSIAAPACLVALLVPRLTDLPGVAAAGVSALVASLLVGLPQHGGLLVGAVAGLATAAALDRRETRR